MKRTPLQRGPGPQRRTKLRRSQPLKAKRGPLTPEIRAARSIVRERSQDICEVCDIAAAVHFHHILPRSAQGADVASNYLHVDAACHQWIHAHPEEARAQGWIISRYPGDTP